MDFQQTTSDMRDQMIQRMGVPKELLSTTDFDRPTSFEVALKAFDVILETMKGPISAAISTLAKALWNGTYADVMRRAYNRRSCWWHCKKHERRKNGINPIRKGQ